jgi:hypothetical protein
VVSRPPYCEPKARQENHFGLETKATMKNHFGLETKATKKTSAWRPKLRRRLRPGDQSYEEELSATRYRSPVFYLTKEQI